jgi:regulator of protease activity HflC (stomatin/prohibitin superfamily)
MRPTTVLVLTAALSAVGCTSADIPQAYRGQMFYRTGPLAFYSGKTGFQGPVLNPGTYFTATYDEVHKVECSTMTVREPLSALTKDGVQFGLNVFVRFSPNCTDAGVLKLLASMPVDQNDDVTAMAVYQTFVEPALGEATREVVSPIRANDVNDERAAILEDIRRRFLDIVAQRAKDIAEIHEVNLTDLEFPADMNRANTERAVQAILRDKAVAERERVAAEIKTMEMRRDLSERQGEMEAARITKVGEALRLYPTFLTYDLQQRMPDIYREAGAQGNLVITAPNPAVFVTTGRSNPNPAANPVPGAAERQGPPGAMRGNLVPPASTAAPAQSPDDNPYR